jgi:hypothetical protein
MKIKDLPLKARIWNKHKKTQKVLWVSTFILFFPLVILQIINNFFDIIVTKFATLRSNIVYIIFKMIYKKELEGE